MLQKVTGNYKGLQAVFRAKRGYNVLPEVTEVTKYYCGLDGVTKGYLELQGVRRGYRGLHVVARGYKGLKRVTGGSNFHWELKRVKLG